MEPNQTVQQLVDELSQQSEAIREEISRSRELSDSNQSEAVGLLEEALQVYQRIEARMESSDEMLNKGMSLIFWVQLATLITLLAMALSLWL